jgi:hypothetical protein
VWSLLFPFGIYSCCEKDLWKIKLETRTDGAICAVSMPGGNIYIEAIICSKQWVHINEKIYSYMTWHKFPSPEVSSPSSLILSPSSMCSSPSHALAHVALRMLAAIFLASQWHFLTNKHAVLAGCSTFWPVNCIFLHKKTRTRCTTEWPFCYWSLFCGNYSMGCLSYSRKQLF